MNRLERWIQNKLKGFLDGPDTFQLRLLRDRVGSYRSSSLALFAWGIAFLRRFLSPAALYLLPVALVLMLYASIAMDAPMRVLFLIFLAVGVVELVFGFLFHPRLEIVRMLPERVQAERTFPVVFEVRNRSWRPGLDLRLDPFHYSYGLRTWSFARIPELGGHRSAVCESVVFARRRGRYRIYSPLGESNFPFNLIKWSCRGRRDVRLLSVYPAFTTLLHFELPPAPRTRSEGCWRYSRIGESMELFGVRDYRYGDDIRRIDWAGSARIGSFVVKEFEERERKRAALIVDTCIPPITFWSMQRTPSEWPELEAALSLAAAVAEYFSRGEAVVELLSVGEELFRLDNLPGGPGGFDAVCDILSAAKPSPEPVFSKLPPEMFRDIAETGSAVVILIGDDPVRRRFLRQLREEGVVHRVILVAETPPAEIPPEWLVLSPDAIDSGQVREL